jgi:hypothetical protein
MTPTIQNLNAKLPPRPREPRVATGAPVKAARRRGRPASAVRIAGRGSGYQGGFRVNV